MCLWCKADKFQDTTSVQQHMVDKGHCKMLRDKGDIFEFADFYDYRFVEFNCVTVKSIMEMQKSKKLGMLHMPFTGI